MTDAELKGIAMQALNMAKRDIEQGEFNFLLASYHEGDTPPLHRMSRIETLIVGRLGKGWLNSGRAKDAGFEILRIATDLRPPEAMVFATAANAFKTTTKFDALPVAEKKAAMDAGHDRHHQMVKEGLLELDDCLMVLAQTPTRVCQCVQKVNRGNPIGEPDTVFFAQDDFDGRLKMYGGGNAFNFTQRGRRRQ